MMFNVSGDDGEHQQHAKGGFPFKLPIQEQGKYHSQHQLSHRRSRREIKRDPDRSPEMRIFGKSPVKIGQSDKFNLAVGRKPIVGKTGPKELEQRISKQTQHHQYRWKREYPADLPVRIIQYSLRKRDGFHV